MHTANTANQQEKDLNYQCVSLNISNKSLEIDLHDFLDSDPELN
jgi:hypothetical protein